MPPIWKAKLNIAAETVNVGAEETVSVTETVCGLLLAADGVMVIVPLYVPGFRPAGLTDTLKLAGAVAVIGLTVSQLPPDAVAVNAAAELAASVTNWACGRVPPA